MQGWQSTSTNQRKSHTTRESLVLLHKQNRVQILTEPVEDHFQIIIVTGLDPDVQADPGPVAVYPIHAVLFSPLFLTRFSVRHTCPTSSRRALKYTTAMEAWNLKLESGTNPVSLPRSSIFPSRFQVVLQENPAHVRGI